jgi:hypothetical protein
MDDDRYLWDKSGPPDLEVERLERLLGPLGHRGEPIRLPARRRSPLLAAVAAVAAILAGGVVWVARTMDRADWSVARIAGAPAVGAHPIGETGTLSVGQVLETDAASRAKLTARLIGEVAVEPNSRLRLVRARAADQRLALERGAISARIWAPPRLFFVETPSALAVDLGCVYHLAVDDRGGGLLSVETGWVALEQGERQAIVPADASCRIRPGAGPGTPSFDDADPAFHEALERIDSTPGDAAALDALLSRTRPKDSLTLWHLLGSLPPPANLRVFDRLAMLVPPPRDVTREGIAGHDRRMIDLWRAELGLPSPDELSLWQRAVRAILR